MGGSTAQLSWETEFLGELKPSILKCGYSTLRRWWSSTWVVPLAQTLGDPVVVVVSEVLDVIGSLQRNYLGRQEPPEIRLFSNDLPGNDFNYVFRSLGEYELGKVDEEKGESAGAILRGGSAGLLPRQAVPISEYPLLSTVPADVNWLSQVPQGLDTERGVSLNKKKVYIAETSPPECHKSIYQDQFQREQVLETNWDPFDDSNDDSEFGSDLSGKIVARYVRAASQSQIAELLVLRGRHS
ncbi:hypothetical protein C4D60_Mb07t06960 [Musa balbisiana]|uniref:Uncharacterized protein n=1 Tax=Musa balbisiana TaxID=52838 RepID=A0A4S8JE25_MUSBA|nr:hypothetical protein C4D60_Mb07t06960 [Musa balbisiana]